MNIESGKKSVFTGLSPVSKIVSLKIFNFKSFSESHFVGPFLGMSAVIGPNGGGKSNIIDAICFALMVPLDHLRCREFKELIFKGGKNKKEGKLASVTVSFICENGDFIEISRVIDEKFNPKIFFKD